ncbi:MAG: DUF4860 domain-containing protein [Eubacteriales bacterium]|nr:DUF4860 domain-containing protein [Eubacteriales bacterium]
MEVKQTLPFSGRARGVFVFALLCVYAVTACLLLLSGLQVYRAIKDKSAAHYEGRTALAYVLGKLRSDATPSVMGTNVLLLSENVGTKPYNTYIFCRDGQLCEYFGSAALAFDPTLGEPLARAAAFSVTQDGARIYLTLLDGAGEAHTACFGQRAQKEVAP